ncbi:unnamed protein product [Didymodactylos carnosus]|uniref:Uncharacterized protein n=1 Tax=Didymodactylos carnosus TaxID=1234261 RepID=A0A815X4S7_9BILA|nr:unnamed protein product [Didymodactylos carnosus]CAF1553423.1 unnamed protein product [Didymodactylos carnosus]CAF3755428.1 unnamed protein product [Didymodactylos carnosus]CAF4414566.1 unnamed protein product [Didymodactylos carnosus]
MLHIIRLFCLILNLISVLKCDDNVAQIAEDILIKFKKEMKKLPADENYMIKHMCDTLKSNDGSDTINLYTLPKMLKYLGFQSDGVKKDTWASSYQRKYGQTSCFAAMQSAATKSRTDEYEGTSTVNNIFNKCCRKNEDL